MQQLFSEKVEKDRKKKITNIHRNGQSLKEKRD